MTNNPLLNKNNNDDENDEDNEDDNQNNNSSSSSTIKSTGPQSFDKNRKDNLQQAVSNIDKAIQSGKLR